MLEFKPKIDRRIEAGEVVQAVVTLAVPMYLEAPERLRLDDPAKLSGSLVAQIDERFPGRARFRCRRA